MYDFPEKIKEYLFMNFEPGNLNNATLKLSTKELLYFLFSIFPQDCITDYDLVDIMYELNYMPVNIENDRAKGSLKIKACWLLVDIPAL